MKNKNKCYLAIAATSIALVVASSIAIELIWKKFHSYSLENNTAIANIFISHKDHFTFLVNYASLLTMSLIACAIATGVYYSMYKVSEKFENQKIDEKQIDKKQELLTK